MFIRKDTASKFETRPDNVCLNTLFRLLSVLAIEMHLVPKGQSVVESNKDQWSEPW